MDMTCPIAASIISNEQTANLLTAPVVTPVEVESLPSNVDQKSGTTSTEDHKIVEPPQTSLNNEIARTSSSSVTVESVAKCSPLAELVNIPRVNRDKQLKTGHVRVLTSSEWIKTFEEKDEQRHVAEEEKQKRRAKWELKKRQREEEMQHKKEEKAPKAATKEATKDAKLRERAAVQASRQHSKQQRPIKGKQRVHWHLGQKKRKRWWWNWLQPMLHMLRFIQRWFRNREGVAKVQMWEMDSRELCW